MGTPNMREGQTPEHTRTEESCMRVAGTCCTLSCWRKRGKKRWTNGANGPRPSCPSGLASGRARSLVTQSPPTMRMRDQLRCHQVEKRKRKKRKKKRRRKKRKSNFNTHEAKHQNYLPFLLKITTRAVDDQRTRCLVGWSS